MFEIGVVTLVTSFVLSVFATWLMLRIAPRLGLIDRPGARKIHVVPTPLGGGVAVWTGVVLTVVFAYAAAAIVRAQWGGTFDWFPPSARIHFDGMFRVAPRVALVLGLGSVVMLLGLVDDYVGLSYLLRLVIQILLVAVLVLNGVRMTLFPPLSGVWISGLLTALWVVGLTNAFNFLDNMDALSGGVGLICASLFCVLMVLTGDLFVAGFLLALVGALGGFLCFNWSPARIFMGDAGSNFIGFTLGIVTVVSTFRTPQLPFLTVAAPLCVMAVPLYDSITVILIRLRSRRSPFLPDKNHFSHRLVALGMNTKQAVLTIYLVTLATGLSAFTLYPLEELVKAGIVLLQLVCLLGVVAVLEAAGRRGNNGKSPPNSAKES